MVAELAAGKIDLLTAAARFRALNAGSDALALVIGTMHPDANEDERSLPKRYQLCRGGKAGRGGVGAALAARAIRVEGRRPIADSRASCRRR